MVIPVQYNLRHIAVRKLTTGLTTFGIEVVVAVLIAVLSLAKGQTNVFKASGFFENILVLSENSQSEIRLGISKEQVPMI